MTFSRRNVPDPLTGLKNRGQLSRRALLRGAGTLVALPLLESMMPRRAYGAPAAPLRFFVFHFPIGVNRAAWKASGTEKEWTLGRSQQPLAPYKSDLCVITGVNAETNASAAHTGGIANFLTARAVPRGITKMGTSADQLIAQKLAGQTPINSLQLGTSILNENPNAEPGYAAVLKDHLSWNNDTPLPKEVDAQKLWDRLFAGGTSTESAEAAAKRRAQGKSILDTVNADAQRLQAKLGAADRAKLDQYFTGLRSLEQEMSAGTSTCASGTRPTVATNGDIRDRMKAMLDLSVLAMQCDLTRVIVFGYDHTVTERRHPFVNVDDGYHIGITHNQPGEPYVQVNTWVMTQFAYLLGKMKGVTEGAGTLLDNSVVYCSSEMGEGSSHSDRDIPIVVAGKGGGAITPNRLLSRNGQTNGHVLLALMRPFGVAPATFGQGYTTPLAGLLNAT